jgi:hypothetical protein
MNCSTLHCTNRTRQTHDKPMRPSPGSDPYATSSPNIWLTVGHCSPVLPHSSASLTRQPVRSHCAPTPAPQQLTPPCSTPQPAFAPAAPLPADSPPLVSAQDPLLASTPAWRVYFADNTQPLARPTATRPHDSSLRASFTLTTAGMCALYIPTQPDLRSSPGGSCGDPCLHHASPLYCYTSFPPMANQSPQVFEPMVDLPLFSIKSHVNRIVIKSAPAHS